jgi:23S rRNA pseudouridine2605 synthase
MCDAIAHPVVRLRRTRFGPIADEKLAPGELRDLTPRELHALREAVSGPRPTAQGPRKASGQ